MTLAPRLQPGFYWISYDGGDPEIARWDAEAEEWLLTGTDLDADADDVEVLEGPVPDPERKPKTPTR
ncbi:hypothetical protein [Muricoccus radiodurans]|uniref:hypothetical protein n=1 Tax=Muricoccus radiodurans TaxID=2231721 RepID=UPI003CEC7E5C